MQGGTSVGGSPAERTPAVGRSPAEVDIHSLYGQHYREELVNIIEVEFRPLLVILHC